MAQDRFRILNEDSYDAVVIGAGLGGLTSAAILATQGNKVLVVDQHYVAGGCATVFKRPGYEFDVGLHYVGDCVPGGPIPNVLKKAGVEDIEFLPLDADGFDAFRFSDGFEFRWPKGFDAFEKRLLETFPAEEKGIRRYMLALRQMQNLIDADNRPWPLLKAIPRSLLAATSINLTLAKFLDTCTQDQRLRAVLAGPHMDYAVAPSRVSLALHLGISCHYLRHGAFYPKGGGQIIADKLSAQIEARGGKILLRAKAERVLVENGRAVGIELFNKHTGRRQVRAHIVISDADIKQTFAKLLPEQSVSKKTRDRVAQFEMCPGIAALYVGVPSEAIPKDQKNCNTWFMPLVDQEVQYAELARGEFPSNPVAYVTVTSLKDPSHPIAPPGITNLQVMTLTPWNFAAWGTTAEAFADGTYHHAESYKAKKAEITQLLLRQLETVWPGISQKIVYSELSTPLTHARYTLASGGTSYGIAATVGQFMNARPEAKTELKGFFIAGASTRAAHGIVGSMLSGRDAAAAAMKQLPPARSAKRNPVAQTAGGRANDRAEQVAS